jgi:hypothetical protein
MATTTPKIGLKKPVVNVETDWGSRINETIDILDDAILAANTTGAGTVTVTDDGAGNVLISGTPHPPGGGAAGVSSITVSGVTITGAVTFDSLEGITLVPNLGAKTITFSGSDLSSYATSAEVDADIATVSGTLSAEIDSDVAVVVVDTDALAASGVATDAQVVANRTEFVNASGSLQTQIDAVESSDVDSVNAVTGAVLVTGTQNVTTQTVGQTIAVTGPDLSPYGFISDTSALAASGVATDTNVSTNAADIAAVQVSGSTHAVDATIHFVEANIDHTAIQNVGDNTHAEIDTHLASLSASGVATDAQVSTNRTEFVNASGSLQTQIDAVEASDVDSVNAVTGAVLVTGTQNTTTQTAGQTITITGPDLSLYAAITDTNALAASGVATDAQIVTNRTEFVNASGSLQTQIDAVEGSDVDSVNAVTGAVLVTGTQNVTTQTAGQTITVTGPDLSPYATTAELASASGTLSSEIDSDVAAVSGTLSAEIDSDVAVVVGYTDALAASGVATDAQVVANRTEFVSASGNLQTQIDAIGDAGVSSVNAVTGHVLVTGTQNVTTQTVDQTITVTGPDLSTYAVISDTDALAASGVATDANIATNASDIAAVQVSGSTHAADSDIHPDKTAAESPSGVWDFTNGLTVSGEPVSTGTGGGVTDHGALTGLDDDDHPQYGQLTAAETAAGIWNFSNGLTVSGVPVSTAGMSIGSKSITVEDPETNEDITFFFTTTPITVSNVMGVISGSSTPAAEFSIRHDPDRTTSGTSITGEYNILTSNTTGDLFPLDGDPTIPANSWVWLKTTATSGVVNEISFTMEYTYD